MRSGPIKTLNLLIKLNHSINVLVLCNCCSRYLLKSTSTVNSSNPFWSLDFFGFGFILHNILCFLVFSFYKSLVSLIFASKEKEMKAKVIGKFLLRGLAKK